MPLDPGGCPQKNPPPKLPKPSPRLGFNCLQFYTFREKGMLRGLPFIFLA